MMGPFDYGRAGLVHERDELKNQVADLRARMERIEKERDRYRLTLEGLTPGGSEYVNDPDRCEAVIRERINGPLDLLKRMKRERDEARRERDEAEARRAGMTLTLDAAMGDATRYETERNEWQRRAAVLADALDWAAEGLSDYSAKTRLRRLVDEARGVLAGREPERAAASEEPEKP